MALFNHSARWTCSLSLGILLAIGQPAVAGSEDGRVASARQRLQRVLDSLPPDAKLPFQPRSQSAFRLRGEKEGR